MKILASVLAAGLILAVLVLFAVVHQQGADEARRDALAENIKQSKSVINELRQLAAEARGVLAEVRAADKQRQAQGEKRRDEMQKTMLGDPCANAAVPDAVADRLREHVAAASAAADALTSAGQSDATHTRTAAASGAAVGTTRNMGR